MSTARERRSLFADPNLYIVFSVTLMAVLGVASVTPAFPKISAELGVSPQQVGLLIAVFTVPGVVLTPMLGILADRYGRKRILLPSLLIFGIAGGACGFARHFELLLGLRLFQGMGAAALGSLNVTIIGDLYEGARRTTAMGYNGGVLSIGTAVYPAVGGALATAAWYAPFFLPVLAVPVAGIALLVLRNPEPEGRRRLGEYLRGAGRLLGRKEPLVMFAASVVTFILIYGAYLSYFPFLLQGEFGVSELWIGLVMSLTSVATAMGSFQLGRLAHRFGEGRLVRTGYVLYVVSMTAIPFADHLPLLIVLTMAFGFANGITIPTILTILNGLTPGDYRAVFMSVNGMLLRLGQTLGPLLAGLIYATLGLDAAFWGSAALAAVMLATLVRTTVRRET